MKRTLIIMAKAPEAGRVKTRLGRTVGMGRAAHIFRFLLKSTFDEAMGPGWATLVAVEPRAGIAAWRRIWPARARIIAQGHGNLGARLVKAINAATTGPVVIIGADAPALRRHHIEQAFRALARADVVFGPADDGGFWLVGLARRKRAPHLFEGVRWSDPHTLADARASLPPGFTCVSLEVLRDIDEAEDLAAMVPRSRRRS